MNNNDPVFFCILLFAKSRVPDFLKVADPKKISGRPDKLEQWVQIDWARVLDFIDKFLHLHTYFEDDLPKQINT